MPFHFFLHAETNMPKRIRAFIVDDSPLVRKNLAEALEEVGPVVVLGGADSESSAVAWLAANSFQCDLVVIDISLTAGSALSVLRYARALPTPLALVVLTDYVTADTCIRCLELGARRIFDKTSQFDDLIGYCVRLSDGDTAFGELT